MTAVLLEELRFVTVDTEHGCTGTPGCAALVEREYVDSFYSSPRHALSVVQFPASGDEYARKTCSRVAPYNARLAARRGYFHAIIDRADWEDDLFALRSSQQIRQGRAMPPAYMRWQPYPSDRWPDPFCMRHLDVFHGVIGADGHLTGYVHLVQCGEITRVNTILGHWNNLSDGVMWLLVLEAFKWHIDQCASRFGLYYTHLSGQGQGLRYFKERFGMRPSRVTWVL